MAVIEGRLQIRPYETENGKRTAAEVVINNIYFGESKKDTLEMANNAPDIPPTTDFGSDDDLPF